MTSISSAASMVNLIYKGGHLKLCLLVQRIYNQPYVAGGGSH